MSEEPYPKVYLYRRIVQSKLFMDANFDRQINLGSISEQAFFSKFHFIRLFRKIYGKSPHQYLSSVRIEKAKRLLEEGVSVTDACFSVGFDSVSSFIGLFKRSVRQTPAVYQARERRRRQAMMTVPLSFIPRCFAARNVAPQYSNFEEADR